VHPHSNLRKSSSGEQGMLPRQLLPHAQCGAQLGSCCHNNSSIKQHSSAEAPHTPHLADWLAMQDSSAPVLHAADCDVQLLPCGRGSTRASSSSERSIGTSSGTVGRSCLTAGTVYSSLVRLLQAALACGKLPTARGSRCQTRDGGARAVQQPAVAPAAAAAASAAEKTKHAAAQAAADEPGGGRISAVHARSAQRSWSEMLQEAGLTLTDPACAHLLQQAGRVWDATQRRSSSCESSSSSESTRGTTSSSKRSSMHMAEPGRDAQQSQAHAASAAVQQPLHAALLPHTIPPTTHHALAVPAHAPAPAPAAPSALEQVSALFPAQHRASQLAAAAIPATLSTITEGSEAAPSTRRDSCASTRVSLDWARLSHRTSLPHARSQGVLTCSVCGAGGVTVQQQQLQGVAHSASPAAATQPHVAGPVDVAPQLQHDAPHKAEQAAMAAAVRQLKAALHIRACITRGGASAAASM
jgi:hypothetical protein